MSDKLEGDRHSKWIKDWLRSQNDKYLTFKIFFRLNDAWK